MVNQVFSTCPIPTFQVSLRECSEQKLRLIEPGCPCRSHKSSYKLAVSLQELRGFSRSVTDSLRFTIPDKIDSPRISEFGKHLRQYRSQMLIVVLIQTPSSSLRFTIMNNECCNKVDSAMTNILKLLSLRFYHSWRYQFSGTHTLQRLQVWFLIKADDNCSRIIQFINIFITPQDWACALPELIIQRRCLPIPTTMWLQISIPQDQGNCGMSYPGNYPPFHGYLCQASGRPVSHGQSYTCWFTAGKLLYLNSHQRGKKISVFQTWERRESFQSPFHHICDIPARWLLVSSGHISLTRSLLSVEKTSPAVSLLCVLFVAVSFHFLGPSEVRFYQFLTKRADVAYDLSCFPSFPEKNVSSSHNATSEFVSQYLKLLIKQSTMFPKKSLRRVFEEAG